MNNPDPHICARCHNQGLGCCVLESGESDFMFGLTKGEIKFISRASGLKPRQFMESDEITPEFERQLSQIHPVFAQTIPSRQRLRLKVNRAGRCIFLGANGCRLPTASRPYYCRLYPFWFTPDERLMVLISNKCLAQDGAHSWREVLGRLCQEKTELQKLFTELCEHAEEHEAWVLNGGCY